jgi:hypothetical protein
MTDSADLAASLLRLGYRGLSVMPGQTAADDVWQASDNGAGLHDLVASNRADPVVRFLAAELLQRHNRWPNDVPHDQLAVAYVAALRTDAAGMANPWGLPEDPHGPLSERVLSLGDAAIGPLLPALGDDRPLMFSGSRTASVGNSYHWRVKDVAAQLLSALIGEPFHVDENANKRDASIDALRQHIQRSRGVNA